MEQLTLLDAQEALRQPGSGGVPFEPVATGFKLQYQHQHGRLYQGDSLAWLESLDDASVDLVFADPPYNIKKADWDTFESQEQYIQWSIRWIRQASRVLKPTGSLYVCGFSEILADLKHPASTYFKRCRWLIWHYKNKANLGNDWGRSHESIIHFRKSDAAKLNIDDIRIPYGAHTLKYPSHPQAQTSAYGKGANQQRDNWMPHPRGAKPKDVMDIPTTCNGMGEKTPHPTQKPEELVRKFVLASSDEGDVVIDPFSGFGEPRHRQRTVSHGRAILWLKMPCFHNTSKPSTTFSIPIFGRF